MHQTRVPRGGRGGGRGGGGRGRGGGSGGGGFGGGGSSGGFGSSRPDSRDDDDNKSRTSNNDAGGGFGNTGSSGGLPTMGSPTPVLEVVETLDLEVEVVKEEIVSPTEVVAEVTEMNHASANHQTVVHLLPSEKAALMTEIPGKALSASSRAASSRRRSASRSKSHARKDKKKGSSSSSSCSPSGTPSSTKKKTDHKKKADKKNRKKKKRSCSTKSWMQLWLIWASNCSNCLALLSLPSAMFFHPNKHTHTYFEIINFLFLSKFTYHKGTHHSLY
uniref:Uncharacterized protein n=1 Tax=Ditylenchus dipsaci TaxID=166011 RepID=A0A915D8D8_9BILA